MFSISRMSLLLGLSALLESQSFAAFIPVKIATGADHTCILSRDGQIKCWGGNVFGQLGYGDRITRGKISGTMGSNLPVVDLGLDAGDKATDICGGFQFSCASTQNGHVKCWGHNDAGQLGQGVSSSSVTAMGKALPFSNLGKEFNVNKISCGNSYVCAITASGDQKCWGAGYYGATGLGSTNSRGRNATEMGDNLPLVANTAPASQIAAGGNHSCALLGDGLRCSGNGSYGQLGLESTENRGDKPETVPAKSPAIALSAPGEERVLGLTAGQGHTCALMTKVPAVENAQTFVKCWGYNGPEGVLGTSDTTFYGKSPNTMGTKLPTVNLAVSDIEMISAHYFYTCALTRRGRVKCWGYNGSPGEGQLGLGENKNRGVLASDMGENLLDVNLGLPAKALSVGSSAHHSCAILINNEVKCWGSGRSGQLGYESDEHIGSNPAQMGEDLPFVRFK